MGQMLRLPFTDPNTGREHKTYLVPMKVLCIHTGQQVARALKRLAMHRYPWMGSMTTDCRTVSCFTQRTPF